MTAIEAKERIERHLLSKGYSRKEGQKHTYMLHPDGVHRWKLMRIPVKVATRSGPKRPAIPVETGHPVGSERSDDVGSFTWSLLYLFSRSSARAYCAFAWTLL